MDESKVEELVTRVLRGLEVFDLFLLLSATAISTAKKTTHLVSQAFPLGCLGFVPPHVVNLSKEVEADVHTGDTDQNSITSSIQRSIVFTVDIG